MKKFLAIIAIASFAVACNNSGEEKTPATDTSATIEAPAAPAPADSASAMSADSTVKAAVDTAKSKM